MARYYNTIQILLLILVGIAFYVAYFNIDYLSERLWIFYLFPFLILIVQLLGLFIFTIIKKNRAGTLVGGLIILSIVSTFLYNSELVKSKRVLQATLMDDLSAIHLTLRENRQFEVNASTLFTEDYFYGKYKVIDNKIIFLDKRYNNDFIPDTVTIVGDKIILEFENGEPNTDFASYFDIKKNELKSYHKTVSE
ncbi:hypothetical protein H8S95_07035 [Pontibacter sp. KCTC 32443]|uniref:hypothetical protein n=1 Tax=Pontibacter TaxID=323449 RepID=UPI00164E04CE|nr:MULTISPECIES: hypothetical protein [Pontibacter]MBC5773812.1 hypothetical protein [Pontibacter sp. KCTC 32443]